MYRCWHLSGHLFYLSWVATALDGCEFTFEGRSDVTVFFHGKLEIRDSRGRFSGALLFFQKNTNGSFDFRGSKSNGMSDCAAPTATEAPKLKFSLGSAAAKFLGSALSGVKTPGAKLHVHILVQSCALPDCQILLYKIFTKHMIKLVDCR